MTTETEVLVLGASAAGISAGIYLKRRNVDFLILGKDLGGEMALSGEIDNYPGVPGTNGLELTQKFAEHAQKYNLDIRLFYQVKEIKEMNHYYETVSEKDGEILKIKSKAIIIATGSKPKKLNIPGEKEFYLKGLSYCTVCDGPLFRGKTVAVIGGGNSATEAALMLSEICQKVFVLTIHEDLRGDEILINNLKMKKNVELIPFAFTKEILGNQFVTGLKYQDLQTKEMKELKVDGIFVHIGMKPNTEFVPDDWGIKNQFGEIVVNKLTETAKTGIFAAGDVTDLPYKQIGIAVGQGITAALTCVSFLNRRK